MCAPIVYAAVALAGAGMQAKAQQDAGIHAKHKAKRDAEAMREAGIEGENVAARQSLIIGARTRKIKSAQVAAMSASGMKTTTGTPLGLLAETEYMGGLDRLTLLSDAHKRAWGLSEAAEEVEREGRRYQQAGDVSAGATILGGASQAYYGYRGGGSEGTGRGSPYSQSERAYLSGTSRRRWNN